jgi:hypothetical protein
MRSGAGGGDENEQRENGESAVSRERPAPAARRSLYPYFHGIADIDCCGPGMGTY